MSNETEQEPTCVDKLKSVGAFLMEYSDKIALGIFGLAMLDIESDLDSLIDE
tara:strand:- start:555 stop:710 length:156 start_codon:yes stop_codon:yes gene_type:complete